MTLYRILTVLGLLVGIVAVGLQFAISIPAYMGNGLSAFDAVVMLVSFFTIITNTAITLIYLSELTPWPGLAWLRLPLVRGMMVGVMVLVMVFYHVLLRPIWQPEGLFWVCDVLLHYVAPLIYVAWWVADRRHGALRFRHLPLMLVPALVYLAYAMARGAVTGRYPYPVLEADRLGYGAVTLNVLGVAIGLALLCAIVIALDKFLGRPKPVPAA